MNLRTLPSMKLLFLSAVAFFLVTSLSYAAHKWPASVIQYEKYLKEARSKHTSLEPAFKSGMDAIRDLSEFLGRDESEIDAKLLKEIRSKLEGFELNPNTETFVGNPKFNFFIQLAKDNKTTEDTEFFELAMKTKPDGIWPIYIDQETDLSGCTVFNGSLTTLYKSWTEFQKKYPKAYAKVTQDEIENIQQKLTESRCFCDKTAETVLKELQLFSKENPKSIIIPKIKNRIDQIKAGKMSQSGC